MEDIGEELTKILEKYRKKEMKVLDLKVNRGTLEQHFIRLAKLTMLCQIAFLPSILLSGIMFPSSLLPGFLEKLGKVFPAAWGYALLSEKGADIGEILPLGIIFGGAALVCAVLLRRMSGSYGSWR